MSRLPKRGSDLQVDRVLVDHSFVPLFGSRVAFEIVVNPFGLIKLTGCTQIGDGLLGAAEVGMLTQPPLDVVHSFLEVEVVALEFLQVEGLLGDARVDKGEATVRHSSSQELLVLIQVRVDLGSLSGIDRVPMIRHSPCRRQVAHYRMTLAQGENHLATFRVNLLDPGHLPHRANNFVRRSLVFVLENCQLFEFKCDIIGSAETNNCAHRLAYYRAPDHKLRLLLFFHSPFYNYQ